MITPLPKFYDRLPDHWKAFLDKQGGLDPKYFNSCVSIQFEDGSNCFFNYASVVEDADRQELAIFTEHCGYFVFPVWVDYHILKRQSKHHE